MIAGPHCYSFFDGNAAFAARGDAEMRAFYLTDFLVRQFDAFVWRPMGLDRHPELRDMIFGNYEALDLPRPDRRPGARRRGRALRRRGSASPTSGGFTGYGDLATALGGAVNAGSPPRCVDLRLVTRGSSQVIEATKRSKR